jgi:ParB family chromosome partitioning protein
MAPSLTTPIRKIPVNRVFIDDSWSVRFDFGDLQGLTQSIIEQGQAEPVVVVREGEETWRLLHGERRLRACLSLPTTNGATPLVLATVVSEECSWLQQAQWLKQETDGSKPLLEIEMACLLYRMVEEFGYSPEQMAKWVNSKITKVEALLRLAAQRPNLPELCRGGCYSSVALVAFVRGLKDDAGNARRLRGFLDDLDRRRLSAVGGLVLPYVA